MNQSKYLEHFGETVGISKEGVKVINCVKCGFFHQDPLPEETERKQYYKEKYFQETKADYWEVQKKDLDYLEMNFAKTERIFRENLTNLPLTILDIGAGSGLFLDFLKKRGWMVNGIEPNHLICELIKEELNLDLFSGTFEEYLQDSKEKFSIVNLSNVFEHVINPASILETIKNKLLLSQGIVSIEVPNDFNRLQRVVESMINNNWWIAKDHLNYFTFDSLKILLKQIGFKIVSIDISFPMELFILMGDDYISNPDLGRSSHHRRVSFEKNLNQYDKTLNKDLYEKFIELGIGRSIIIYGKKP